MSLVILKSFRQPCQWYDYVLFLEKRRWYVTWQQTFAHLRSVRGCIHNLFYKWFIQKTHSCMHLKRKGLIICTRTHAKEASNTIGWKYFLKKQHYYIILFQKTNEKIRPNYYDTWSRIVFVRFLGELKAPKRLFEINWPLLGQSETYIFNGMQKHKLARFLRHLQCHSIVSCFTPIGLHSATVHCYPKSRFSFGN